MSDELTERLERINRDIARQSLQRQAALTNAALMLLVCAAALAMVAI